MYLGSFPAVIIYDYEIAKDLFSRDVFSGVNIDHSMLLMKARPFLKYIEIVQFTKWPSFFASIAWFDNKFYFKGRPDNFPYRFRMLGKRLGKFNLKSYTVSFTAD